MKKLKANSMFDPNEIIDPPMLILISGASCTGKSTLAKFLKEHIKSDDPNPENEKNKRIKLLSTD